MTFRDRTARDRGGAQCHAPGLGKAMREAGHSVQTLCEETGYSPAVISELMAGEMVHRRVVSRIAGVLGASPAQIRGEKDDEEEEERN